MMFSLLVLLPLLLLPVPVCILFLSIFSSYFFPLRARPAFFSCGFISNLNIHKERRDRERREKVVQPTTVARCFYFVTFCCSLFVLFWSGFLFGAVFDLVLKEFNGNNYVYLCDGDLLFLSLSSICLFVLFVSRAVHVHALLACVILKYTNIHQRTSSIRKIRTAQRGKKSKMKNLAISEENKNVRSDCLKWMNAATTAIRFLKRVWRKSEKWNR